ncbi:hypothetical protein GLW08_02985 [Pontibacillus yanchengensis]|uniref:Uncharacterized protein n=2 Tax=Pontibacillus yanchengensis TaxID=462910 RepID=A0ACC7VED6_9BACI|nr:hypothetical protein [Pontibacillus yanchengensis]MYL34715.1 hypothetical protein [Pontibacillus yanchengensis]MYL52299.1 hypothetical protein [Pontibacillus yanchengensis]
MKAKGIIYLSGTLVYYLGLGIRYYTKSQAQTGTVGSNPDQNLLHNTLYGALIGLAFILLTILTFVADYKNWDSRNISINKLNRILWFLPSLAFYLMFFGFGTWVVTHAQAMETYTPGTLAMWVIMLLLVLLTAIVSTAKYTKWIDEEKL